jgi:hypothetical protein
MKWHNIIAPTKNVQYSCQILFTEMFYAMLAINELIEVRVKILTKRTSIYKDELMDKSVIWDTTISTMRLFQSTFAACVKETVTPNAYSRWLKAINHPYIGIQSIRHQYLDFVNFEWIALSKEKRLKDFNRISKRISDYYRDEEFKEISDEIDRFAREHNVCKSDVRFKNLRYPETFDW